MDIHSPEPSPSHHAKSVAPSFSDVVRSLGSSQWHGTLLVGVAHESFSPCV